MFKSFIGLDPGLKGGIGIIDVYGITAEVMPVIDKELIISDLVEYISPLDKPIAVIEKVHAMPKQGVSSTFTFGKGYGELIGMLKTLKVPYILVTPQAWKKKVLAGLNWKGEGKKASIEFVMRKYPNLDLLPTKRCRVPHDGMADAVCMAEYGRITNA